MNNTYLMHHGIKGMHWGIRRYQNPDGTLTPAGRAKKLNDYDQQLREATIKAANSAYAYKKYSNEAERANALGKTKKAQKLANEADASKKRYEAHNKRMHEIGKKYVDELKSLKDSGLAYKVDNVNFTGVSFKNGRTASRDIIKKYGRESCSNIVSNAASGNVYKVKDSSKISKKKQIEWSNKHNIQSIRPQRVNYVYY